MWRFHCEVTTTVALGMSPSDLDIIQGLVVMKRDDDYLTEKSKMTFTLQYVGDLIVTSHGVSSTRNSQDDFTKQSLNYCQLSIIIQKTKDIIFWFILQF